MSVERWHSPALLKRLQRRVQKQRRQLAEFHRDLPDISLRQPGPAQFSSSMRSTDPQHETVALNTRVEVGLSQLVPGLLGLFLLPSRDPTVLGVRLAYYAGVLMLGSEAKLYDDKYAQSMSVAISVKGRVGTGAEESVVLTGDPGCAATQALHKRAGVNCQLRSVATTGARSVWMESVRTIQPGQELFISYDGEHSAPFAIACFSCHLCIAAHTLQGPTPRAFRCKGFIDGWPCPHHTHVSCITPRGVAGRYCHYCALDAAEDDSCFHPSLTPTLAFDTVADSERPSGRRAFIRANRPFPAVVAHARRCGYEVVRATAVSGSEYPSVPVDERHKWYTPREIEYALEPIELNQERVDAAATEASMSAETGKAARSSAATESPVQSVNRRSTSELPLAWRDAAITGESEHLDDGECELYEAEGEVNRLVRRLSPEDAVMSGDDEDDSSFGSSEDDSLSSSSTGMNSEQDMDADEIKTARRHLNMQ